MDEDGFADFDDPEDFEATAWDLRDMAWETRRAEAMESNLTQTAD